MTTADGIPIQRPMPHSIALQPLKPIIVKLHISIFLLPLD